MNFNDILFVILLIVQFSFTSFIYKIFGKNGLFVWIGAGIIIANIQVLMTVELFGLYATLGNSMYASIYLSTDLISEKYGQKEAKKAVYIGFVIMVAFSIIMQIVLLFKSAETDFAYIHLEALFSILPRITLASLTAYLISQILDVTLFFKIKGYFGESNQLWIRNNASTIISQFIDTVIFVTIAFIGVYPLEVLKGIFITTYFFKLISALLDTPFIYLMRSMRKED